MTLKFTVKYKEKTFHLNKTLQKGAYVGTFQKRALISGTDFTLNEKRHRIMNGYM